MVPVIPDKNIIKHFRHKNGSAHGEPETPAHLNLKKTIYEQFIKHGDYHKTKIEERFLGVESDDLQIADVFSLINEGEGQIVIECQCSNIPYHKFVERTKGYTGKIPVEVLWIFGGDYWERTQNYNIYNRDFGDDYKYQTISDVEKNILNSDYPLIYYDFENSNFYQGDFEFKWKRGGGTCTKWGWYDLDKIPSKEVPNLILDSIAGIPWVPSEVKDDW